MTSLRTVFILTQARGIVFRLAVQNIHGVFFSSHKKKKKKKMGLFVPFLWSISLVFSFFRCTWVAGVHMPCLSYPAIAMACDCITLHSIKNTVAVAKTSDS